MELNLQTASTAMQFRAVQCRRGLFGPWGPYPKRSQRPCAKRSACCIRQSPILCMSHRPNSSEKDVCVHTCMHACMHPYIHTYIYTFPHNSAHFLEPPIGVRYTTTKHQTNKTPNASEVAFRLRLPRQFAGIANLKYNFTHILEPVLKFCSLFEQGSKT